MSKTVLNKPGDSVGLEAAPFEAAMITAEKYRESMYDTIDILNMKTALSLVKDDLDMSKECAKYSLDIIAEKIKILHEEEKRNYKKLQTILEQISKIDKDVYKIDIKSGLEILESISQAVESNSDLAKANYYKIFKQY